MINNLFDIKSYLTSKDISYKEKGKNVTKGWININCILPGCSDDSNHLGINLKTLIYKCWICGQKGHAIRLVQIIENCSEGIAKQIIKRFPSADQEDFWQEEPIVSKNKNLILPSEIEKEWPQIHLDYLSSRGFDPLTLIAKFLLRPVYTLGKYRFRIIIPIYMNNQLVSFTAMDVLRQDERPKYMDCPISEAIIPVKQCLYNIDSVKDKAIIYEGPTGVWRFGDGSICSFTADLTIEQINLLVKKKVKQIFILFDPNAQEKGERVAHQLSGIIPSVEQIRFKSGDPKDLSLEKINSLKKNLGFI